MGERLQIFDDELPLSGKNIFLIKSTNFKHFPDYKLILQIGVDGGFFGRKWNNYEKLERSSNQHSLDV